MSRASRIIEDLEKLKDQDIIVAFVRMDKKWLITLHNVTDLYLNNREASAFVSGAKAAMSPQQQFQFG